jgi:hypothetical protein
VVASETTLNRIRGIKYFIIYPTLLSRDRKGNFFSGMTSLLCQPPSACLVQEIISSQEIICTFSGKAKHPSSADCCVRSAPGALAPSQRRPPIISTGPHPTRLAFEKLAFEKLGARRSEQVSYSSQEYEHVVVAGHQVRRRLQ